MHELPAIIFILDDHADVRRALERLLQSAGYETLAFSSADALLSAHDPQRCGCAILDFDLANPHMDGLKVQSALMSSRYARPIIFLSGRAGIETSVAALRAGAVDFLIKPVDVPRLFIAVREALELDNENRRIAMGLSLLGERLARLTSREREVLEHVVQGRFNKQIAADLGIHEKTIKVHRGRVMRKMEARSVAELVQLAGWAGIEPREVRGIQLGWAADPTSARLRGASVRPVQRREVFPAPGP